MKTKIKFSDIAGMLKRDEMKEIIGGCGTTYACGSSGGNPIIYGGGGGSSTMSGFGGGTAIGSTFGGQPYSGYSNSTVNNFNSSSSNNNYSSISYISNSYSNGWINTSGGFATSDPIAISRYLDFISANNGVVNYLQANAFINNEATAAGRAINNVAYSIQLDEVVIKNNYHGPSTIPQGIVINNNGMAQIPNTYYGGSQGGGSTTITPTWDGLPIHGSSVKPTVFEAAIMSKAVYGDYVSPNDLKGWAVSTAATGLVYNDPASGFKSQLFERTVNGKKEYCYATAGTESVADMAADALQIAGLSRQYQESVHNAIVLKQLFGDSLSFTGHSLGGGMAEANARATGDSATTFNAAGLSVLTTVVLGLGSNFDTNAYIMASDPLNAMQLSSPLLTTAGGNQHFLPVTSSSQATNGHSIDTVIESLRSSNSTN
jgi:hypothetical protein